MFICSTTSNLNNSNLRSASKTKRKNKTTDVQNLENTLRIPHRITFFGTMRLFETFWIAPKGPPSFVSIFGNTRNVKKLQTVPPFRIFATVTFSRQNLIFKIFGIFLRSPKGPLQYFFIFCNHLEFHKARRVPPFQF